MGLKTILVCLTTTEHAETLMRTAVPLARKHNAHLIGLHTTESLLVYPYVAMHVPGPVFSSLKSSQKVETDKIENVFRSHTRNEDFQSEFRLVHAQSVTASERMVESARSADLVLMAHDDKEHDRRDQHGAQTDVIRNSGRPVIVVPLGYEGPEIGRNIVLGWSDTREAARAAHDLLTLADEAAKVTILRVGPKPAEELSDYKALDIAETYARHNLRTTVEYREIEGKNIAETLAQTAFENGADLIATGAFGHSKAYDFVMGATTYDLLFDTRFPILFSK